MSHWHDEIGKVSYYIEQVILGNVEFEQDKFVEAIKILQEALIIFHDYAHLAGGSGRRCKGMSDNPDHSCHGDRISASARNIYKHAEKFNKERKSNTKDKKLG